MRSTASCSCCGQLTLYRCTHCNLVGHSPECFIPPCTPAKLSVKDGVELVRGWDGDEWAESYRASRTLWELRHRRAVAGACSYCDRTWTTEARLAACEQRCNDEAEAASRRHDEP